MRITISHSKSQVQAIQAVDQAMDEVFRGLTTGPVTIVKQQKLWNGSVMTFSLTAKMGFLQNPISGMVEVTAKEVTINADLGMLSKLFPTDTIRATVESRVRGLLT
jgi:hypothetical protein